MTQFAEGLIYYVAFLFSTTLHEAAHALAAKLGGDLTAYHGGQVTLDPRPHIRRAPVGMVLLPLVTVVVSGWPFGFASAPYDISWAKRYPRRGHRYDPAGRGVLARPVWDYVRDGRILHLLSPLDWLESSF